MKQKSFLFAILLGLCSCTSDEFQSVSLDSTTEDVGLFRSVEEIKKIASDAPVFFGGSSSARGTETRTIDKNADVIPLTIAGAISRSDNPLMYVVNYEDENGFAIVSAKKNAPSVIAFIEDGSFSSLEELDNPGFNIFIKDANNYLSSIGDIDFREPGGEKTVYETEILSEVGPYLNLKWTDDNIFSAECPNNVCGTANIALAMFMYYYRFMDMSSIDLTYKQDGFSTLLLDWDLIDYHEKSNNVTGMLPVDRCDTMYPDENIHLRMAQLIREIGYRSNTDYSTEYPVTEADKFKECLNSFGITQLSDNKFIEKTAIRLIPSYQLFFMYGVDDTYGTQFWICDGYKETRDVGKRYITNDRGNTWVWDGETIFYTEKQYYNHMNWCTRGAIGYYLDMTFNPTRNPMDFKSAANYIAVTPYGWLSGL